MSPQLGTHPAPSRRGGGKRAWEKHECKSPKCMGIILPRETVSPHILLMGQEDGEHTLKSPNLPPMHGRRHCPSEGLMC